MSTAKQVSFKEDEQELIEFMKENKHWKNFSYYIKGLIIKDMNNSETPKSLKEKEKSKPRRNTNFDM